jgi:hypothetical protein
VTAFLKQQNSGYYEKLVGPVEAVTARSVSLSVHFDLNTRYHQTPSQEKEAFAHRYADEFRHRLVQEGRLPFDPMIDSNRMKQQGLMPEWFVAGGAES